MSDEIDEIWALYADDGAMSLQAAEDSLLGLRGDPGDMAQIAALFRALHTFKGNSRLLGLSVIESRAHIAEDLVGLVRDEGVPLDPDMLGLLFEATDTLRGMMDDAVLTRRDADEDKSSGIVARMRAKYEACRAGPIPTDALEVDDRIVAEPGDGEETLEPPRARLGDDPLYLEIFLQMAADSLSRVEEASIADPRDGDAILELAQQLRDSAQRTELDEWVAAASRLMASIDDDAGLQSALDAIRDLLRAGLTRLGMAAPETAQESAEICAHAEGEPPKAIAPILETFARRIEETFSFAPDLLEAAQALSQSAQDMGYYGVAAVAADLGAAQDSASFERGLFDLYRMLTSIDDGAPDEPSLNATGPLAPWCSDKAYALLARLSLTINGRPAQDLDWEEIRTTVRALWCVFHARGLFTACHVASALIDLIERVRSAEMSPDPPLLRIVFSFLEASKPLLLDVGADDGESSAKTLFRQTSAAMTRFCERGRETRARAQLRLPESFEGMLSADSLDALEAAFEAGRKFYVIRADTERHPEIGAGFLDWLGRGVSVIGSVTVFEGNATLFDFLVASPGNESEIEAELLSIDPERKALQLRARVLEASLAPGEALPGEGADDDAASSASLLETIGEVFTAHSSMKRLLERCVENDGGAVIERLLRDANGQRVDAIIERATQALRSWKDDVEQLLALENQISASLDRLQREFVASRLRPGRALLTSLESRAQARAAEEGCELNLSIAGHDATLDVDLLDVIRDASCALLDCALGDHVSWADDGFLGKLNISLESGDQWVVVRLESRFAAKADAPIAARDAELSAISARIRAKGGELRVMPLENYGATYLASLPQAMAVVDGMVVRAGASTYVVPVHSVERIIHAPDAASIKISADNHPKMLRIDQQTLAPIIRLARGEAALLEADGAQIFVITRDRGGFAALQVDDLIGQQPLLVRPLKGFLASIKGVVGCAPLGDGGVAMVLDPSAVVATLANVA